MGDKPLQAYQRYLQEQIKAGNNTPEQLGIPPCTGYQLPEVTAGEGDGVWILDLTEDNWDEYNKLPPTFDGNVHLQNLKDMGGIWYHKSHPRALRIINSLAGWEEPRPNRSEDATNVDNNKDNAVTTTTTTKKDKEDGNSAQVDEGGEEKKTPTSANGKL